MKAILISINPKWVAKILNGEKTIEIRKKFPKDYVGWIYLCITQDKRDFLCEVDDYKELHEKGLAPFRYYLTPKRESKYHKCFNGKVVARFWCDKVEEINKIIIYDRPFDLFETKTLQPSELLKQSCLRAKEMTMYFMFSNLPKESAAIHITNLEIFGKPKEIKEFYKVGLIEQCLCDQYGNHYASEETEKAYRLTRAPQNYCYIEI